MKQQPPYKTPSEAIWYVKKAFLSETMSRDPGISWREVALAVSSNMIGRNTSKAEIWNVAHKKYKCPSDVAKALRKMKLLDDKRYGFFYRVKNKEEYEQFKLEYLDGRTFAEWVNDKRMHDDII